MERLQGLLGRRRPRGTLHCKHQAFRVEAAADLFRYPVSIRGDELFCAAKDSLALS
jgi:hypothetical protein